MADSEPSPIGRRVRRAAESTARAEDRATTERADDRIGLEEDERIGFDEDTRDVVSVFVAAPSVKVGLA